MRLIPNARRVALYAWSVWLNALAVLLIAAQIAEALLPFLEDYIPETPFKILTLVTVLGSLGARFIQQRKVSNGQQD
jgi:hypothetical protein